MRDDFAVFILSHGRPNQVYTIKTLEQSGYNGKWYIILDNEDKTIDEYIKNYGQEHIVVFDRLAQAENMNFDICDNFTMNRNSIVYARNKCFDIANDLGLHYFFEFEDDYLDFTARKPSLDGKNLHQFNITTWDEIIDALIEYLEACPMMPTLCFSQIGDWMGGIQGDMWVQKIKRKAMNTFLCTVERPFTFLGRMNDDVNLYVTEGARGKLFMTIRDLILRQQETQKTKSGNADMYKSTGTYVKSFYSVMLAPSCVKVSMMGQTHQRIHHSINWEHCCPKIISDKFQK